MKKIYYALLFLLFFCFHACTHENNYSFDNIESLFSDTSLMNICIRDIPRGGRKLNKYIFFNNNDIYYFEKGMLGWEVIGDGTNSELQDLALKQFVKSMDLLKSKNIISCCLGIDNTVKLNLTFFDKKRLQSIDTLKEYENYKYIFIRNKNLRLSFAKQEFYSNIFYCEPYLFYYSNR